MKKRENDDGDSMMTLISAADVSKSLVICPDKRSNIARFINGINNHTRSVDFVLFLMLTTYYLLGSYKYITLLLNSSKYIMSCLFNEDRAIKSLVHQSRCSQCMTEPKMKTLYNAYTHRHTEATID